MKKGAKELASKLNGIDYAEIQRRGFKDAEEKNLLVLFGSSDDLIELRGAIDDEIGCWQSCTIWLDSEGVETTRQCNDEEFKECFFVKRARKSLFKIKAIWETGDYFLKFETDIPHETFDVLDDGEKYCQGIVIDMDDLKAPSPTTQTIQVNPDDCIEESEWFCKCPTCNRYCIPVSRHKASNFCPICGSKIIWEE